MKREYEGEAVDLTWQDIRERPYKNEGETVAVPGESTEIPDTPTIKLPLTENQVDILELVLMGVDTSRELAECLKMTKDGIRDNINMYESWGLIRVLPGEGKYGADKYKPLYKSVDDLRKAVMGNTSFLPNSVDPLLLTENQRKVVEIGIQHPELSQEQIGHRVGISAPSVSRTFEKVGLSEHRNGAYNVDENGRTELQRQILSYHESDKSTFEIARKLGCSAAYVYDVLSTEVNDE